MWIVQSRQLLFYSGGVSLDKVSYALQITDVNPEIRRMRGISPFFSTIVQHIVQGEHFVNNSYFTLITLPQGNPLYSIADPSDWYRDYRLGNFKGKVR